MEIISHRGYWKDPGEKNMLKAFERSFSLGFGTETDIRDYKGKLVIAHDMATNANITLDDFFQNYNQHSLKSTLALNIKADGLQEPLKELLEKYSITNYFVFDMSIPDTIGYKKSKTTFYSRLSEYEINPTFISEATGIWLDCFEDGIWYTKETIETYIKANKKVAIVSADLHKRNHLPQWKLLNEWQMHKNSNIILCTDFPEEAASFFK
jgi:glycerophosphoryl diester phosphodiesterase